MRALIPFCLGAPERSFYQEFVRGISNALRELGHEPSYVPFNELGNCTLAESQSLVRAMQRDQPQVALDVACWGYALALSTTPRIFCATGIPYAGVLCDHPFNQWLGEIQAERLFAVCPDRGHPQQIKLVYPDLKLAGNVFLPPAVEAASDRSSENQPPGRSIDILYVGNLQPTYSERFWRKPGFSTERRGFDPAFCDAVTDAVIARPERALHLAVEETWRGHTWKEPFELCTNMRYLELYFRHLFRREAVWTLARSGVRIHIVGRGWDWLASSHHVSVQPPVPYDGMLRLAGAARICIDASTYLEGVNDRVFSYAVNGAVCFTNASGYLRAEIGEDQGMRYYSLTNLEGLIDEVRYWLARPAALQELGDRARSCVLAAHTWRHRMESLLVALLS
jgi:hypothetical protein